MNHNSIYSKLEWHQLIEILADFCQTEDAKVAVGGLKPDKSLHEVRDLWHLTEPLRDVANQGYTAPIGNLQPMLPVFKAAELGQILSGEDLWEVLTLLTSTSQIQSFCQDFGERCVTLSRLRKRIYTLPKLFEAIKKAIDKDGTILNEATPELKKIRHDKRHLRTRIEEKIEKLMQESQVEMYLQDNFFTLRAERYVIPMRLDGRGRVKGNILDTSDSGQTLFIEPAGIAPLNEQLLELEVSEKIEILKILRTLSAQVAEELDVLQANYGEIIELDKLTASALLASKIRARAVEICKDPVIQLNKARHPLIELDPSKNVVANDIRLDPSHNTLVITGPNAGGKTVVLKTLGMIHLMAKSGLLIPVDEDSKIFLYEEIFVEMGDSQSLESSLSTFSGHLAGLKPIISDATVHDLVLLDELASGTEPSTGAALARAIIEQLSQNQVQTVVTTHFDQLKALAIDNEKIRNGSMEYNLKDFKPTYQLILDVPGQSYGLEVAEQLGLPHDLIARAKDIRGSSRSEMDKAISDLMKARENLRQKENAFDEEVFELKAQKARWEQEVKLMQDMRKEATGKMKQRFNDQFKQLKGELEKTIADIKTEVKEEKAKGKVDIHKISHRAKGALGKYERDLQMMNHSAVEHNQIPGIHFERARAKTGQDVYIVPLSKKGKITKIPTNGNEPIEVAIGVLKIRVHARDLRYMSSEKHASMYSDKGKKKVDSQDPIVHPNPTNSFDIRSLAKEDIQKQLWSFLDKALLRGESAVIIQHEESGEKPNELRNLLKNHCPFNLRFRPGRKAEGGESRTVIYLKT